MSWQHAWPQDAIAIGINLVRLKSWACLFLISIPRFSVTLFPYQFVGQLRFLLPVPCLPGSQWNWHILRNNHPLNLCGNISSVKLHRDLPCIGPLSTSQGWAPHTKALAVPHGTNPGRRNNLTTLNLLLPFCKRTSLTGCFCLRLLWQEDHVLISMCCTPTIYLHARPQRKHSTHCANRSDPCRKVPAFSVRSDGPYRAYTLRRSWTWLICR